VVLDKDVQPVNILMEVDSAEADGNRRESNIMGVDAAALTHIPATQNSSNDVAISRRCNLQSDPKSDFGQMQTRKVTPEAYINSLEASGIPYYLLHPKKGCIVMCLRNVSPEAGCYNGTRMILNGVVYNNILRCTIINGRNAGEEISIPRIKMRPQDLTNQPCEWEILQFPVRLAYMQWPLTKSKAKPWKK
jgi:hypothetical protein